MDGKYFITRPIILFKNNYSIIFLGSGSGSAASGSGLHDINSLFTDPESPVTTGGDGGILTTVTTFLGGLSMPALAGIAAGGGLLLIIITILFIIATIALT